MCERLSISEVLLTSKLRRLEVDEAGHIQILEKRYQFRPLALCKQQTQSYRNKKLLARAIQPLTRDTLENCVISSASSALKDMRFGFLSNPSHFRTAKGFHLGCISVGRTD
jgi:hypothetical protein